MSITGNEKKRIFLRFLKEKKILYKWLYERNEFLKKLPFYKYSRDGITAYYCFDDALLAESNIKNLWEETHIYYLMRNSFFFSQTIDKFEYWIDIESEYQNYIRNFFLMQTMKERYRFPLYNLFNVY